MSIFRGFQSSTHIFGNQTQNLMSQHVREQFDGVEAERHSRMRQAQDAYYGRYPDSLKTKVNKPNDNTSINYARMIVDIGVSFLFGNEVMFDLDKVQTTDEERWLEYVLERNNKMVLLHELGTNGGIYGHTFLRILRPQAPGDIPRIINIDPMAVDVRWNPKDIDRVEWFHITHTTITKTGEPLMTRERIVRQNNEDNEAKDTQDDTAYRTSMSDYWTIYYEEKTPDDKHWKLIGDPEIWPWSFPPVFHCKNLPTANEFWGMSDLERDIIQIIYDINFFRSTLKKIFRYHGGPRTFGTGFQQSEFRTDVDGITILPNPQARVWNLDIGGSPEAIMAHIRELRTELFMLARIPEVAIGNMVGIGALSGVALDILYRPLIDKTASKRRLYGTMLKQVIAALMVIGGYRSTIDDVRVTITWPTMLPRDRESERAIFMQDRNMGIVSLQTVSEKLDYDFATEQARIKKETERGIGVPLSPAESPRSSSEEPPELSDEEQE